MGQGWKGASEQGRDPSRIKADRFVPLDDTGAQLLFRFVAAAYESRALGIGSHWPFESWGRFLPEHTTAVSMLDNRSKHGFPRPRRR